MRKISTVGLFCCDEFEETPKQKVIIMSKLNKFHFNIFLYYRKTLKIKGVTLADSGVFECKGVNGFGSISVQIHLVVKNRKDVLMKSNKIETLLNEVHSQILVPKQPQRSTPSNGIGK